MVQSYDDIKSIHSQTQLAILEWKDLIIIKGSCLGQDKSAWYLIDYKWIRGILKYTNPGQDRLLEDTNKVGGEFPPPIPSGKLSNFYVVNVPITGWK